MHRWKKIVLAAVGAVVAAAWITLAVALVVGAKAVGAKAWTAIVLTAAIATEVGIWITAAILGLTVFQARKRIWQWMVGRFRPTPPA